MSLLKLLKEVYDYDDIPNAFVEKLTHDGDLDQDMMIQHQAHKVNVFFVQLWMKIFGVPPSKATYQEWLKENNISPFATSSITINSSIVENFINRLIILKLGLMTKVNLLDFGKFANEVIDKLSNAEFILASLIEKLERRYHMTTVERENVIKVYVEVMKYTKAKDTPILEIVNPATQYILGSSLEAPKHMMNGYHNDLWLLSKDIYFQAKLIDHHVIVIDDMIDNINLQDTVQHITQISGKYCIIFVNNTCKGPLPQFPASAWVCVSSKHTINCIPRIAPWCLVVGSSKDKITGLALESSNNVYISADTQCPNTSYWWKTQMHQGLSIIKKTQIMLFDQFVYDYYNKNSIEIESKYYQPRNISSQKAIVLIDNRPNELSVLSCKFALLNTDEHWRLVVFTSTRNIEYYKKHLPNYAEVGTLPLLDEGVFDIDTYNDIMESVDTWKLVESKGISKVLIIQDDGMLIRPGVDRFIHYDYVGAPWVDADENKEIKERISSNLVGNGGLSLRSVNWMIKVTTQYSPKETFYHNVVRIPEDVYYVKHMTAMGAKIPTAEEASYFSVEQVMNTKSIGFHKCWLYNPPQATSDFFNSIIS